MNGEQEAGQAHSACKQDQAAFVPMADVDLATGCTPRSDEGSVVRSDASSRDILAISLEEEEKGIREGVNALRISA